jgi:hypothetical protein
MRPRDKVGVLIDSNWTRWGREEWVSINIRGSCASCTGRGGITRLCRARLTRSERTGSRVRLECESRSRGIQLLGWSRSIASLAGGESDILPGSRRNGYNCRLGFTSEWRNSLDSHVRKPLCSRRLGSLDSMTDWAALAWISFCLSGLLDKIGNMSSGTGSATCYQHLYWKSGRRGSP